MSTATVCQCDRCGRPCRVAESHTKEAEILRKSLVPKGLCVDCATTAWLKTMEPICTLLESSGGPECLRLEPVREQFAAIMKAGKSDAVPDEIDWDRVIETWDLPLPGSWGKKRDR